MSKEVKEYVKIINALSLFDGMRCGAFCLQEAGIKVNKYYAAEINKYAIQVADDNFPNTINLGDVTRWREWDIDWSSIDLIMAGFPCQAWSFSGEQQGLDDPRGALVLILIEIFEHIKSLNPDVKFFFENVFMKAKYENFINAGGFLPSITASEGLEISSLIITLWAVAWAAAQVIKVLKPNANN